MTPDEQAERDCIALVLDTLIGWCAMEFPPEPEPPATRLSARLARAGVDPGWLEYSRKHAVA